MTIKAIDGTIGDTLAQLGNRSTIFQMHSKRHESHEERQAPEATAGGYYQVFSLGGMGKTSSIYQRNARRVQLRQEA